MKVWQAAMLSTLALALTACQTPPRQVEKIVEEPIDFTKRARLVNGPQGARLIFPDGLLFDTNMSTLKPQASASIDACMFIIDRTKADVIVEGHTDSVGSPQRNAELSLQRAETVRAALVQRKVAPSRIKVLGLADSKPEVPNAKTPEELAQNRRAEIIFKGETAESLNAPYGCGDPPVKRKVMVDAPKPEGNLLDKIAEDVKKAVDKAKAP